MAGADDEEGVELECPGEISEVRGILVTPVTVALRGYCTMDGRGVCARV